MGGARPMAYAHTMATPTAAYKKPAGLWLPHFFRFLVPALFSPSTPRCSSKLLDYFIEAGRMLELELIGLLMFVCRDDEDVVERHLPKLSNNTSIESTRCMATSRLLWLRLPFSEISFWPRRFLKRLTNFFNAGADNNRRRTSTS
ncbi:unnamed protein product [Caenorhabditis auriculariae]|uniref:Uncharacterized protein n=1 Tax=Caenorhabditis auriculariae TaxID=2777116 RepID=A0A8S1H0F2_9PELO|nr:unnamed protein product [Caenorhabditis auriculariae]